MRSQHSKPSELHGSFLDLQSLLPLGKERHLGNCLMPWVGGGIPMLLRYADLEAELIPGAISSAQPFSTEKGVVVTWAADNSRELLPRW